MLTHFFKQDFHLLGKKVREMTKLIDELRKRLVDGDMFRTHFGEPQKIGFDPKLKTSYESKNEVYIKIAKRIR